MLMKCETHPGPLSLCVRYFPGDMYIVHVVAFFPLSVTIVKLVYFPHLLQLQFPFIYISQKIPMVSCLFIDRFQIILMSLILLIYNLKLKDSHLSTRQTHFSQEKQRYFGENNDQFENKIMRGNFLFKMTYIHNA